MVKANVKGEGQEGNGREAKGVANPYWGHYGRGVCEWGLEWEAGGPRREGDKKGRGQVGLVKHDSNRGPLKKRPPNQVTSVTRERNTPRQMLR